MALTLRLITPRGLMGEFQADEAYFPTTLGPVGVMPGHTRACFAIKDAGILHFTKGNETSFFTVFSGVVIVEDDVCTISSPLIEDAASLDLARAKESEQRALDRLEKKAEGTNIIRAKASLLRAATRIEAKSLASGEHKN